MREIKEPDELIAIATRQGVANMTRTEARIILGYVEGHDYVIEEHDGFKTCLHDLQAGDDTSEDYDWTIREIVEFCQEMNEELMTDINEGEDPDGSKMSDLEKDDYILQRVMEKVSQVVPPRVKKYTVSVTEYLRRLVVVEAASISEAETMVERMWNNGEVVLTADDFKNVIINVTC